jgi:hypothetical protein
LAEHLWDRAYDDLKKQDAALIQAYEKILSNKLNEATGSEQNIIAQHDAHARRNQMRQLIYDGLNKTAKEAKVKEVIGIAISTKDIITNAVQAVPKAALAWTGVCMALEVILPRERDRYHTESKCTDNIDDAKSHSSNKGQS